jgi:hypothetical protein
MFFLVVAYLLVGLTTDFYDFSYSHPWTGYYNEARILDPVTFATVNVLPNIPGSVTSFLAGRTSPNQGASVFLPQKAPYTDPITVLICGGSNFGIALDNCVSIQPESNNPTWVIERMVRPFLPHLIEITKLTDL